MYREASLSSLANNSWSSVVVLRYHYKATTPWTSMGGEGEAFSISLKDFPHIDYFVIVLGCTASVLQLRAGLLETTVGISIPVYFEPVTYR